ACCTLASRGAGVSSRRGALAGMWGRSARCDEARNVNELMHTVLDALRDFSGHDCTPRQRKGRQWRARCPAHKRTRQNFEISVGSDGRVLLHCFAHCQTEEILDALDLRMVDLYTPETRQTKPPKPITVSKLENADYFYRDKDGVVIFKMERRYGPDGR